MSVQSWRVYKTKISRSDKCKEVIMFVVTYPTMINICTKFHSNLRRCSVKMVSPLGGGGGGGGSVLE